MQLFRALKDLSRPLNGLITALSVGVGALCVEGPVHLSSLLLAMLSAALINAAGNAFNDLCDIDIDRVNRPDRPLPSQRITPRAAALYASVCTVAGLLMALAISPLHALLATAISALLVLYSAHLKNSVLWGNALVGAISAAAFPYGALTSGLWGHAWIPAAFALLFHLGREIVKDIEDMAGDSLRGTRTLPLRYGLRTATRAAAGVYSALITFTLVPFAIGLYGPIYLVCALTVDLVVIHVLYQLCRSDSAPNDGALGRRLKWGMLLGLIAIVLGEWSRSF